MIRHSMTKHLISRYEAKAANIERLEHRLPNSDEVLKQGLQLADPGLYITLPDDPNRELPPEVMPQPSQSMSLQPGSVLSPTTRIPPTIAAPIGIAEEIGR